MHTYIQPERTGGGNTITHPDGPSSSQSEYRNAGAEDMTWLRNSGVPPQSGKKQWGYERAIILIMDCNISKNSTARYMAIKLECRPSR